MALEIIKEVGLAHWASYLVNDDASGLEDDEVAAADAWLVSVGGESVLDAGEEVYMGYHGDMLADLVEYSVLLSKKVAGHSLDRLPKSAFARGA